MKHFLRLALATIVILGTVSGQTASRRGLVANLKNQAVAEGCGCYFRFRNTPPKAERYIFFSSIEEDQKAAWMNIAGRDVKLTLEKEEGPKGKEQERVGRRSTARWRTDDITVNATYIATRVCGRNEENCESTNYAATFIVRKAARSQVVKAVGSCGC